MTLAKTCQANNMMQGLKKAIYRLNATTKAAESQCFSVPSLYYETRSSPNA